MIRRRRYPGSRDPVGDAAAARVDREREQQGRAISDTLPLFKRPAWRTTADRDALAAVLMASTFVAVAADELPRCSHCGAEPVFTRRVRRFGQEWTDLGRNCRSYLLDHRELPGERLVELRRRRFVPARPPTKIVRLDRPFLSDEQAA